MALTKAVRGVGAFENATAGEADAVVVLGGDLVGSQSQVMA